VKGTDYSGGTPDWTCPVRAEIPERDSLEQLARLDKYITWSIDHNLAKKLIMWTRF
jgi:hypothetical protein